MLTTGNLPLHTPRVCPPVCGEVAHLAEWFQELARAVMEANQLKPRRSAHRLETQEGWASQFKSKGSFLAEFLLLFRGSQSLFLPGLQLGKTHSHCGT